MYNQGILMEGLSRQLFDLRKYLFVIPVTFKECLLPKGYVKYISEEHQNPTRSYV